MHSKIKSAQSNSIWFAGKVAGFATSNFVAMLNPLVRSNQVQNKNNLLSVGWRRVGLAVLEGV